MSERDGGPACPTVEQDADPLAETPQRGLSVRDVFAAHALTGLLIQMADWRSIGGEPQQVAAWAYELADALLAERRKG